MGVEPAPFARIWRIVGAAELDKTRRAQPAAEARHDQRTILEHDRGQIVRPAPAIRLEVIAALGDQRHAMADAAAQARVRRAGRGARRRGGWGTSGSVRVEYG